MIIIFVVPERAFVAVAPWESLCADVHIRVLRALGDWRLVCLVLPMFGPLHPGIRSGDNKSGYYNTV